MKIKGLLFLTLLLPLCFFSFQTTSIPDPELYAKTLIATIQKNDTAAYIKTFGLSTNDFKWLLDHMREDVHTSAEYKAEWERKVGDSTKALKDMRRTMGENYEKISQWITEEEISLSQLQYVRTYYDIEYEKQGLIHVLEKAVVYVKHKEQYYAIYVRDVFYINGRWVFGWISEVNEVDQYFENLRGGYGNYYAVEEPMTVDTMAVAYDTAAAVADYYEEDYTEEDLSGPPLTKKQQKIMKKIDALDAKKDKLYEELSNEY